MLVSGLYASIGAQNFTSPKSRASELENHMGSQDRPSLGQLGLLSEAPKSWSKRRGLFLQARNTDTQLETTRVDRSAGGSWPCFLLPEV